MKQIVDKLKSLESDKLKFKEFLKEILLTHEPFVITTSEYFR